MKKMPTMVEVMTPSPHTVEVGSTVKQASTIMYGHNIRHLPVTASGKLMGLLTDRDVKLAMAVGKGVTDVSTLKVEDACIDEPYTVEYSERLDQVLHFMVEHHIGSALVMRSGKLVGIFTLVDAARKLRDILPHQFPDA